MIDNTSSFLSALELFTCDNIKWFERLMVLLNSKSEVGYSQSNTFIGDMNIFLLCSQLAEMLNVFKNDKLINKVI